MADDKPTLEPTEWQMEIANDCANMVCDPGGFVRGETYIVDAIAVACARQREEDAKIAEADLLGSETLAPADMRGDNASSERTAIRIAAAIRRNGGK